MASHTSLSHWTAGEEAKIYLNKLNQNLHTWNKARFLFEFSMNEMKFCYLGI